MKLTYPHMGEAYIAIKAIFDDLGIESIVPAFTTKSTLQLGAKLSPENICLPFKIMLGNYINSIKAGADTVVITGSCGPCRFGYYGPIQKQILEDLGYKDIDMIILDSPGENLTKFIESIKKLAGKNVLKLAKAIHNAYKISCEIDNLNEMLYYVRPRANDKAKVRSIIHSFKADIVNKKGSKEILDSVRDTITKLKEIEINSSIKPLKVGIIGEIYTIIEPFSNLNVEEKLGDMGIEVHRSMTVKDWTKNTIVLPITGRKPYKYEKKLSKPYLPVLIGGHAQQCIGHAVHYAKEGYDGLIQIYPMTCMPEIVSRSILPQVEKDYGIPILYLIVDEQTGEAGYITRLEAFVDYIADSKINKAVSI